MSWRTTEAEIWAAGVDGGGGGPEGRMKRQWIGGNR